MHALPIAIRLSKPEKFEKTFRPHFKPIDMSYIDPKILPEVTELPCSTYLPINRGIFPPQAVHSDLKYVKYIKPELRQKVHAQIERCIAFSQTNKNGPDTPYSTIVHRDLWTNNFMISKGKRTLSRKIATLIKFVKLAVPPPDANRNVSDVKIYDFQLYFYHSFALDLVFFLFTSVRLDDLNEHFDSFIQFYHSRFYKTLMEANCPLEHYTFEL